MGVWEVLDTFSKNIQLKDIEEARHYESIKMLVKVCKASGMNFALLYTHNINMAMNHLHDSGEISTEGKLNDGD